MRRFLTVALSAKPPALARAFSAKPPVIPDLKTCTRPDCAENTHFKAADHLVNGHNKKGSDAWRALVKNGHVKLGGFCAHGEKHAPCMRHTVEVTKAAETTDSKLPAPGC